MCQEILREIRSGGFSFQKLSCKYDELKQMRDIPQNPAYHGEGDVYRHTEMVCESLLALPEWGGTCAGGTGAVVYGGSFS